MLSGFFIISNQRKLGGFLMIIAMVFILMTKDNPFIVSHLKSINKEKNQRAIDFLKHISLVGAALLLLGSGKRNKVEF